MVFRLGGYDEKVLYGLTESGVLRFRKIGGELAERARNIASLADDEDMTEFDYQCSLFWPEFGELTQFLGTTDEISEIVAELRTVRLQFAKRDTTPEIIRALADALEIATGSVRLKREQVDRIIDLLEQAGGDPYFPASYAEADE